MIQVLFYNSWISFMPRSWQIGLHRRIYSEFAQPKTPALALDLDKKVNARTVQRRMSRARCYMHSELKVQYFNAGMYQVSFTVTPESAA
jgi:hypothetical protein